ncbi:hypothetical protein ZIOFF_050137 [Zingiber officinale]|uniref:X8 domain-containing protein n=1 Tax=Zingiber officinale TaxID=94328 RepID=A0A8J5KR53_ZINOF|nr:hypothetical protein ZIOFF_050137 [Zingiber officinale]
MPGTTTEKLVANINYACGSGLADCRAIQEGGPCYSTDIIKVANYAMNAYYYIAGHENFNCYFDGSGRIIYDDPSKLRGLRISLMKQTGSFMKQAGLLEDTIEFEV